MPVALRSSSRIANSSSYFSRAPLEKTNTEDSNPLQVPAPTDPGPESSPKNSIPDESSEEGPPPKPPPSFNGSLAQFIFHSSTTSSPNPAPTPPPRSSIKRPASAPSPAKRSKKSKFSAKYAPPSKYAHLNGVPDAFLPGLICVFIGLNPGIATATAGHAYSSPTNLFWKLLHVSGITPDKQVPSAEDQSLPARYSLGHTNLVSRPTLNQSELSKEEMVGATLELEEKIRRWRPEAICVVGKGIWEAMWKAKHRRAITKEEFRFGWQEESERFGAVGKDEDGEEEGWEGARVFVVPSTSGLVAGYSMQFKKDIWTELGDWIGERRKQRGEEVVPKGI
ncbi:uracil DNA N-glycosylase Thp1 [Rhizina undulata]